MMTLIGLAVCLGVKLKAKLIMSFNDEKLAKSVYLSLKPDDKNVPKYLEVNSVVDKNVVTYEVKIMNNLESILKLRNTIDDILSTVQVVEKTLEHLSK